MRLITNIALLCIRLPLLAVVAPIIYGAALARLVWQWLTLR